MEARDAAEAGGRKQREPAIADEGGRGAATESESDDVDEEEEEADDEEAEEGEEEVGVRSKCGAAGFGEGSGMKGNCAT